MGQKELPKELKDNIWKKGQSGNPSGRPKEPEELKFHRKNGRNGYLTYLCKMITQKIEVLKKEASRSDVLVYEAMALKLINEALKNGSIKHLELIMKLMKIDINMQKIEIETIEEEGTGLEKVPTEKLILIKGILEGE